MLMYTKEELQEIFRIVYDKSKKRFITKVDLCNYLSTNEKYLRENIQSTDAYEDCDDVFLNIKKTIKVFDNIDEEAAYWLGYLMADGCFTTTSRGTAFRLMLECKIEDKEILEKFCEFLDIRKDRIRIGHNGRSVALAMTDNVFSTSPSKYGINQNKSHTENHIPQFVYGNEQLFWQYFRGLVDGDGTIYTQKGALGVGIVGNSKTFMEELKNEMQKYLPEPTSAWILERTIQQQKDRNATQSLYLLKIGSGKHNHSNLHYLYQQFYNNQKIILTRKEQLLKSIL